MGRRRQPGRPIEHGMCVVVSVVGSYANALGGMFGHVEIEMTSGQSVTLADNFAAMMSEFGLLVTQPGAAPNQFIL